MADSEEYGSDRAGSDDLGSDFGEMEAEYDVDEDGNPLNVKLAVSGAVQVKPK